MHKTAVFFLLISVFSLIVFFNDKLKHVYLPAKVVDVLSHNECALHTPQYIVTLIT